MSMFDVNMADNETLHQEGAQAKPEIEVTKEETEMTDFEMSKTADKKDRLYFEDLKTAEDVKAYNAQKELREIKYDGEGEYLVNIVCLVDGKVNTKVKKGSISSDDQIQKFRDRCYNTNSRNGLNKKYMLMFYRKIDDDINLDEPLSEKDPKVHTYIFDKKVVSNYIRANDNRLIVGKDDKKSYDPSKNLAVYEPCKGANHPGTLIVPAATAEMVFEWDWSQYEGYLDNDERPFPAIVMNIQSIDKLKDSHNYYDSVNKNRSEIGKVFDSWAKRGIMRKTNSGYFRFSAKLGGEGNIASYRFDMNNAMKALGIKEDMPPETIFSQIGKFAEYNAETDSVEEVDTSHAGFGI